MLCFFVTLGLALSTSDVGTNQQRASSKTLSDGCASGAISPDDRREIQALIDRQTHAAKAIEGGFRARNPGQRWSSRFDASGFIVEPDAGTWKFGLELERYGWGGALRDVHTISRLSAEQGRVERVWDESLTEWYVNDRRGVEHGFTLLARTRDATGPLTLDLALRGNLDAVVSPNARDVCLVDEAGAVALEYSCLTVFDADARCLSAKWSRVDSGLRLTIDDSHARYPLTIDPIVQSAYLKASNTDADDRFGSSVAASGSTIVIGAVGEDSNSTGINGDQNDNSAPVSGAAYVFTRGANGWVQQAYLKSSNSEAGDHFGWSVGIDGDTIVVGAYGEDSAAVGVGGNQNDDSANWAGAAYVFVRQAGTWSQQAYLKASNTDAGDQFGRSVAISGDRIVVGAYFEDSSSIGNELSNDASAAGAAYVFERSGTTWSQAAYLKASNADVDDEFGVTVAIFGDRVLIGAPREDCDSTDVNPTVINHTAPLSGAAYSFVRSAGGWAQDAYIKASNTGAADLFGSAVSIHGSTAVVGAPLEDGLSTGQTQIGAAYVFVHDGTLWSQTDLLRAPVFALGDQFGSSVAVLGGTIVVGAPHDASNASGVGGSQLNNSIVSAGAVYVFAQSGSAWIQSAYVKASNPGPSDNFGSAIALAEGTIVVAAWHESSSSTGVGGNQFDDSAQAAGAAYVFHVPGTAVYCTAGTTTNSCIPTISGTGTPSATLATPFTVMVDALEGERTSMLVYSVTGAAELPWSATSTSTLCVAPPIRRMRLQSSGGIGGSCTGSLTLDWNAFVAMNPTALGQPFSVGDFVWVQAWLRDPPAPKSTNLSDAMRFALEP